MTYAEFQRCTAFAPESLLAFARGRFVTDAPAAFAARLPLPPMLMLDRILRLECDGGRRGVAVAERSVAPDDWYFACHFAGDPVQPGCLELDGVWQLLGFWCAWAGGLGAGRALGCGEVEFSGQVLPDCRLLRFELAVRRFTMRPDAALAIGDATVLADGVPVATVHGARAGTFRALAEPGSAVREAVS
jgi:3-hydroxyacyl-[acyl-carrier protein] dehydratase/trans-2-decenoyl-[acyl-carrier protein] isomerase